jgi:hypothetical protein
MLNPHFRPQENSSLQAFPDCGMQLNELVAAITCPAIALRGSFAGVLASFVGLSADLNEQHSGRGLFGHIYWHWNAFAAEQIREVRPSAVP